jgi:ABC-type uncharacterized transport system permease subunit
MLVIPHIDLTYRAALGLWVLEMATQIYLYAVLWRALYDAGQSVAGIDYRGAVTYSTLAALQGHSFFGPDWPMRNAVRDGSISYGLLRPAGYLWQLFAQHAGGFLYSLLWMALGFAIAAAMAVAFWPPSWTQCGLALLSLGVSFLVHYHLRLLLGLSAFWTVEIVGITAVFLFVSRVLSGAVVPLWFFPDWLRDGLALLPFAAVAHAPLSIFIGRLQGTDAWLAVGVQALWAVALVAAGNGLWRLAERKVVVQGG